MRSPGLKTYLFAAVAGASFLLGAAAEHLRWLPHEWVRALFIRSKPQIDVSRTVSDGIDVVMLGDSLTEQNDWSPLLPRCLILNRGVAGDTTEGILARLPTVTALKPKLIVLLIGINDIRARVAPNVALSRMDEIIARLKNSRAKLIVQSVLLTGDSEINMIVRRMNILLAQLSASHGVEYVDLNSTLATTGKLDRLNSRDGLHLTQRGYQRWGDMLRPIIAEVCLESRDASSNNGTR